MGSPNVLIKLFWLSQGISQPVIFTVKKALESYRSLQNKKQSWDTHLHPVLSLPFLWFLELGKLCQFYFLEPGFLVCDGGRFISWPATLSNTLHHMFNGRKLRPHAVWVWDKNYQVDWSCRTIQHWRLFVCSFQQVWRASLDLDRLQNRLTMSRSERLFHADSKIVIR